VSYSTEHTYLDLIDQKIDEAILMYAFTGIPYGDVFINYRSVSTGFSNKINLEWANFNYSDQLGLDSFENILGFSYDLILHKYAETY
jgi:hypothetical protein